MKRETKKEKRIREKKKRKKKKITKRGGRSGQGGGSRLAREIYSRQPALCHHQRSPCVLSTLRYCGRFPPSVREAEEKSAASFFAPLERPFERLLPPPFPSLPNNHLLPINSLDF